MLAGYARGRGNTECVSRTSGMVLTALALVAVLAFGCFVLMNESDSADAVSIDGLEYSINESGATVTGYSGSSSSVIIPSSITQDGIDYPVISIDHSAFYGCSTIESVVIPDSVNSLGSNVFEGCSNLTDVVLGDNISTMGPMVFHQCTSLVSVKLPSSLKIIPYDTFRECRSLEEITIPDSVTTIDYQAFLWCDSLKTVNFGKSVSSIGEYAFRECISLRSIELPNSLQTLGYNAFNECSSLQYVSLGAIQSVPDSAFYECTSLIYVDIPNTVTSIGDQAFMHCYSLRYLEIPSNVTTIGSTAFEGCGNIFEVVNLSSISIENDSYQYGFSTYGINIYDSLNEKTFSVSNDGLVYGSRNGTTYLIGYIGNEDTIILPETIDGNEYNLLRTFFNNSNVKSITIPNTVKDISASTFYNCISLESVILPDKLPALRGSTFSNCSSLVSITIPSSVTSIENSVFSGCSSLESINIPDSVSEMWDNPFVGCGSLQSIVVGSNNPYYCSVDGVLFNRNQTILINYPSSKSGETYYVPDTVTHIYQDAFSGSKYLTKITLGSSVSSINSGAFYYCEKLQEINVSPLNVTYISNEGVLLDYNEQSLLVYPAGKTQISYAIPDSVINIEYGAFWGQPYLKTIQFPEKLSVIGSYSFENCKSLTSISVPDSVIEIGLYAFEGCSSLTTVSLGESIKNVSMGSFSGCTCLESIEMPQLLENIESQAFFNCTSLSRVTIPTSVTTIGNSAFSNCTSLDTIHLGGSLSTIEESAFWNCYNLHTIYVDVDCPLTLIAGDSGNGQVAYWATEITTIDGGYWFTINYTDKSGNPITTPIRGKLPAGTEILAPIRQIEGYTFADSDRSLVITANSSENIINLKYSINQYSVYYYVDDELVYSDTYDFGSKVPVRDPFIKPGCTVTGWYTDYPYINNGEIEIHLSDVTLSATSTVNQYAYTVNHIGPTGEILQSFNETADYGTVVEPPVLDFPGYKSPTKISLTITDDSELNTINYQYSFKQLNVYYYLDNELIFTDTADYTSLVNVRDTFVKTGFTVSPWESYNVETENNSFSMPAEDVSFTAISTINQYSVTYAVDGGIVYEDTFDYGTVVTIRDSFNKTGYVCSAWETSDVVIENGKFTLGAFDVSFTSTSAIASYHVYYMVDGETVFDDLYDYRSRVPVREAYNKPYYVIGEWSTSDVAVVNGSFTLPANDVTFLATSTPIDYEYAIHYHDALGNQIADSVYGQAGYGTQISPDLINIVGYSKPANATTITISDDSTKNIAVCTYTVNSHTVTYVVDGETLFTDRYDYGTEVIVRPTFEKTGYTVTPWVTQSINVVNGRFTLPDNDVTFAATSAINKYGYTVNYTDQSGKAISDSFTGEAEYSSTVNATIQKIPGYTAPFEPKSIVISDNPTANIVTYVYTINSHTVTYVVDGETLFTDHYDYGTEVIVRPTFEKTGYTVTPWVTEDISVEDGKFSIDDKDVTFSASSSINQYGYIVKYTDASGKDLTEPLTSVANFGTKITAPIVQITGYIAPTQVQILTIGVDESANEVTYTYAIIQSKVTYIVDDSTIFTDTFDYGTEVKVRDQYGIEDGTVSPWYTSDVTVIDGKFTIGQTNVTFRATTFPNNVYGTVGDLEWHYSRITKTLEISGQGELTPTYEWQQFQLDHVIVGEGVTAITGNAKWWSPYSLKISSTVVSIQIGAINSENLASIDVNLENKAYSSVDGVLFNKEKTILMLYPRNMNYSEYTIPNGVVSVGSSAFTKAYFETLMVPAGVSFATASIRDCSTLTKIVLEDSNVVFENKSIRFSDEEVHSIEVCAPEGFVLPQEACYGDVKITYTVLKSYNLIYSDSEDTNWGIDIGIGVKEKIDTVEKFNNLTFDFPYLVIKSLLPDFDYDGEVSVSAIDIDSEIWISMLETNAPYIKSDLSAVSFKGTVTMTFIANEDYNFGSLDRYTFDGLSDSFKILSVKKGDSITVTAAVNMALISDRAAHIVRYDGDDYPYKYLSETQLDNYRGYVDFKSVKITSAGEEREFSAMCVSEDFVFSYINEYELSVKYGALKGKITESTEGSGSFIVKIGDNVCKYSPVKHITYQGSGVSGTSGTKLPTSFPDNYTVATASDMKIRAENMFALQATRPDTAVKVEQNEAAYTITVDETASSVSQETAVKLIENAENDSAVTLTVTASVGTISLDNTALKNLKKEETAISIEKANPKDFGLEENAVVIEIKVGDNHTNFGGGKITVTVPYSGSFENKKAFYIVDGKPVESYEVKDNGDGTLSFEVDHLSTFAIADSSFGESPVNNGSEFPIMYAAIGVIAVLALAGGAIVVKKRKA